VYVQGNGAWRELRGWLGYRMRLGGVPRTSRLLAPPMLPLAQHRCGRPTDFKGIASSTYCMVASLRDAQVGSVPRRQPHAVPLGAEWHGCLADLHACTGRCGRRERRQAIV
jgi:hypothetical protein